MFQMRAAQHSGERGQHRRLRPVGQGYLHQHRGFHRQQRLQESEQRAAVVRQPVAGERLAVPALQRGRIEADQQCMARGETGGIDGVRR